MRTRSSIPRPRRGMSLIEVMIAMILLSVVMLSLGKLATIVSQRGRSNDLVSKRTFVLQQQANRIGALPYASLASLPATTVMTSDGFRFTRRISLTTNNKRTTVKLIVVPSTDTVRKDSLLVDRTNPPTSTVLCTGC